MTIETPFLSADELEDIAPLVVGDIGAAQDEVVRRLGVHLPALTQSHNAKKGLVGNAKMPVPKANDILPAPMILERNHIGKVLVGLSVQYRDQGPGAFSGYLSLVVYSIDARIESSNLVREMWERSEFVVLSLFPYLTGCRNASGKKVWRQLIPQGVTSLDGAWGKEFSGTRAFFELVQSPNMDDDIDATDPY